MPTASYRFSCNTEQDIDLIQWLDKFPGRERTIIVKRAIRLFMRDTQTSTADKLERLEEQLAEVLREIINMKREGLIVQNNGSEPKQDVAQADISEITDNILSMLNE